MIVAMFSCTLLNLLKAFTPNTLYSRTFVVCFLRHSSTVLTINAAKVIPRWAEKRVKAAHCFTSSESIEDAGYKVTFTLYNTANFGVPQVRERLIFFASRDGSEIPFISPTHDEFGLNGLKKWRTLKDAIGHLKSRQCHVSKFPETRLKYYRMLKSGQELARLATRCFEQEAIKTGWRSGGGKTGFYRRLSWNKPSPTLVTRPTMPATDLCHPELIRPLSCERVCGHSDVSKGLFCRLWKTGRPISANRERRPVPFWGSDSPSLGRF